MPDEPGEHSDEFLRGEPEALELEVKDGGFYAEESKEHLEINRHLAVLDSVVQGCEFVVPLAKSIKKKFANRRGTKIEGIRKKYSEHIPELVDDIKHFIESTETMFDEFVIDDELPLLPESHLELLQRYTTFSHDSILLKMRLSQARADLNYIRSEM